MCDNFMKVKNKRDKNQCYIIFCMKYTFAAVLGEECHVRSHGWGLLRKQIP